MYQKLHLSLFALLLIGLFQPSAFGNTKCPIMVEDGIDEEEVAEFEGEKVLFCCGRCVKLWNENPKYYIKVMAEVLPQFKGMEEKLELDKVKVIPQKFCPIYQDSIVTPDSPTLEYKGKTIYLFKSGALRRWNRDPEAAFKEAIEAGVLPQFEENKQVPGKTNEALLAEK